MSIELDMAGYYARRALEYERVYTKPERQQDLETLRTLIEKSFAGERVLEVACGTGYWTSVLSRSAAGVCALDINHEVLEIAMSKPLNRDKVFFQRADVYGLPKFDRGFTAALAAFWWSHVPKKRIRDFLAGLHSALVPGARVMFIDNVYVDGSSIPVSRSDAEGNTYQLRLLDDGSAHEVLKNFPTDEELRGAVCGVAAEVTVQFLQYYWILGYVPVTNGHPPNSL